MTEWLTPSNLTALLGALAGVVTAVVALVGAIRAGRAAKEAKVTAGNAHDVATTTRATINGLQQQVDDLTGQEHSPGGPTAA